MTGRMGAVPVCGPLPVTLIDFKARVNNDIVNLYWNTTAEYNVKKIIVERSIDGVLFDRLTEVSPRGSSNSGADYAATDLHPFSGNSFYRLKIIDADGSIEYSQVSKIQMAKKDITITQLYPNPVRDLLHIQVQSDKIQSLQLYVFDITGKQLLEKTIDLKHGVNDTNIPFTNWGAGMYIIKYRNTAGSYLGSFKIVKD
jgi:hypothetical protein